MTIKNTLSATKAREDFFSILAKVQTPGQYVTLTDKGSPKAVIMSADEFESWQETLEVMRDFPDLTEAADRAEREFKAGAYATIDQILEKEGYVLNDKARKSYAVPSRRTTKRTKRAR